METFYEELKKSALAKPIEFLMLLVTFVGLAFAGYQLKGLNDALESQAYGDIDRNLIDLDKVFVENPEYRQYFYDSVPLPKLGEGKTTIDDVNKIAILADLKLDIIDAFFSQSDHIDWAKRHTYDAWIQFYRNSFRRSPVLCHRICTDWLEYGKSIRGVANDPLACGPMIEVTGSDPKTQKCQWKGPQ